MKNTSKKHKTTSKKQCTKAEPFLQRIGNLRTSKEIGRYVQRIIKQATKSQKNEGDVVNNAYKLTVMASMLAKIMAGDELTQRVKELEEQITVYKTDYKAGVKNESSQADKKA